MDATPTGRGHGRTAEHPPLPRTAPSQSTLDDAPPELGNRRKLLLSAAAVGASAVVAVTGTMASFSTSVSRGHTVATGVPDLLLGATGGVGNRLDVDTTGLSPGDSFAKAFDITNAGSTDFTSYSMTTSFATSSLLDTDAADGLQVRLERCSDPWVESGTLPAFSYACPGTRTTVVAFRPIAMSAVPLAGMASAVPGATDHMLLTEMLPTTAGNAFQNLSTAVVFTFDAG